MNNRILVLCASVLLSCCMSCGSGKADDDSAKGEELKPAPPPVTLPDKFIGNWHEYHLEKSILFDVCDPRFVVVEQGGTEFFWMTLITKIGTIKYKIHRTGEEGNSLLIYATPNGSLAGTDTTLLILEPVTTTAGVMRVREYANSTDYPAKEGNIYFVGDTEVVSPNPNPEPCDS